MNSISAEPLKLLEKQIIPRKGSDSDKFERQVSHLP